MPWRAITVPTSIVEAAGYSPARKSLSLFNLGTAEVRFSQDPSNVSAAGFSLPVGASVTLTRLEGDEPEATLFVVAVSGSQDVRVQESVGPASPVGP